MTSQSTKPSSFNAWFRANPGHLVRAAPLAFTVFTLIMIASVLFPGDASISDAFVTAAVAGSVSACLHVGWRYLKTTAVALRPESNASGPRGFTLMDIMVALGVVPVLLVAVSAGIQALQG